jgi:two-component system, chemotaxis family, chemotaxis protein CheY
MSLNVLIIDDSAVMRSIMRRALTMSGVPVDQVREAANGLEGLHVLDGFNADLAFVDINMPVMNGEEFIDRVRQQPEQDGLALVAVSTESSEPRIESLDARGVHFLHKPFSPERLRDAVLQITGVEDV